MPKKLVIVESPAKARTVGRFLGNEYVVRASVGHIRDLPQRQFGVDLEHDFEPHYVIPPKKKDVVKGLRVDAKEASDIYLATDPDREGEAISWHLLSALTSSIKKKPVRRVEFHEITRDAVDHAFANPREINMDLVDAQQARRVLDRIVGYTLSPLLRKKMSRNRLSAGRVQSVAVRLVVDREREIQAFTPIEYWSIEAELEKRLRAKPQRTKRDRLRAQLVQIRGEKFECSAGEQAQALVKDLESASYVVSDVRRKEVQRNPSPPFITSTMQQEASKKIGFTARRTMAVAQQLYEGLPIGDEGSVGLITYMRTDSTNVAEVAQAEARGFVVEKYGPDFVPPTPRQYKTKAKGAQEAHEAIRPTSVRREPSKIKEFLSPEQFKLYDLVWKRFLASQMAAAIMDTTSVDIKAGQPGSDMPYLFRATGSIVKFAGFMIVYTEGKDEDVVEADDEGKRALPPLTAEEGLDLLELLPEQHFTQPPPRYTEATLIRALEEYGIGRPSTYAPILSTIQDRGYVERIEGRRLVPTEIGFLVNDVLVKHFPEIVDFGFTAHMEEDLDRVAAGDVEWVPVMREFYGPFANMLALADQNMEMIVIPVETTDQICEKCGSPMVIKRGRFGRFIACSAFPKCHNAKSITIPTGAICPDCGGDIVEKTTRRKRIFFSCANYPECKFATWNRPIPTRCPGCGGLVTEAGKGQQGYVCIKCGSTYELGAAPRELGQLLTGPVEQPKPEEQPVPAVSA
jgi:DNA topoisomerase-1